MEAYLLICVIFAYVYAAQADVYLEEKFNDGKFSFFLLWGTGLGHSRICRNGLAACTNRTSLHFLIFFLDTWEKNWIYSKHPGKEFGKFVRAAGKFYNNEEEDQGT